MSTSGTQARAEGVATVLLLGVAIAALGLTVAFNPGLVRFWPFTVAEFLQLIVPLLLVALFIERTLEVFVTPWRAGEAERLEKEAVRAPKATANRLRVELSAHKSTTRRLAFGGGIVLGIVVSALGVRALSLFVDPAVFKALPELQQRLFSVADVLLTGAVLGGGADGLHKIVSVFTNFLDTTASRFKEQNQTP